MKDIKDVVLVNETTGEVMNVKTITKNYASNEDFVKMFLGDFLMMLGICDSTQLKILIYVLKNTNLSDNLFYKTYRVMEKEIDTTAKTIAKVMLRLQEKGFIRKIKGGVWMLNPEVMYRGSENKKNLLIRYVKEN